MMRRLLFWVFVCLACTGPLWAQEEEEDPAVLVADKVSVGDMSQLIAEGNVEVLHGDARLTAPRLVYDREGDSLAIDGPIRLTRGGDTIILASAAELSPDLTAGILTSARMVMNSQLQIAAADIQRVSGRYTRFNRVIASVCQVCAESETPLWQVRARRITHDEAKRRLYFDHARMEVAGLPILYLPQFSIPDPSVQRATGFLTPSARVSDRLGPGIKAPYFIALGDHQDITITPYVSPETRTLELRYRRAFRFGDLELKGAVSNDDLEDGGSRGYLFAEGDFALPNGFALDFDLKAASDRDYLFDYDYADDDQLENTVSINRTRRDELITGDLAYFETLRETSTTAANPALTAELTYRKRFVPGWFGGIAGLTLSGQGDYRTSDDGMDGGDYDSYGEGMDVGRLSAGLDWRRDRVLDNGIVLAALGEIDLDYYQVRDDDEREGSHTRVTPAVGAEMRWPMAKTGSGARYVLEPMAQITWSREDDDDIPNEDSAIVEFDEANLLSFSRFPGYDARESGLSANLGLGWTRYDPTGWSVGLTLGRVWRAENLDRFATGTGLEGASSDWLTAVELDLPHNLQLWHRALFDDEMELTKSDTRLNWAPGRLYVWSSLSWLDANEMEERRSDLAEWQMSASYLLVEEWRGLVEWRYDIEEAERRRAGIGLQFQNECLFVDLSLSRRFSSSTTDRSSTDFGVTVSLTGFGAKGTAGQARRCAQF